MGNYSHLMHEEGCELDVEKLKQICDSWELEQLNWIEEADKEWKEHTLGDWIDGWKIQGYWYPQFVEFLYACAYSMEGLTEDKSDNHLQAGDIVGEKMCGGINNRVITSIHPDYGWICTEYRQIEISNIVDVFNKRMKNE